MRSGTGSGIDTAVEDPVGVRYGREGQGTGYDRETGYQDRSGSSGAQPPPFRFMRLARGVADDEDLYLHERCSSQARRAGAFGLDETIPSLSVRSQHRE